MQPSGTLTTTSIFASDLADAITTHEAESDPHTQYLPKKSSGGLASDIPEHTHPSSSEGGTILAEELKTSETDTAKALTPDGSGGVQWTTGGGGYSDEQAQDAIASILDDTGSIAWDYNDPGDSLIAEVLPAGVDHNALANLTAGDPHTQYHTDDRALDWLGTRSTSDLPEGSNLYYTDARVDDRISIAGGITDTDDLAEGVTNLYFTDARVLALNSSLDHGILTGLGDDDHTQYLLLAGRAAAQQDITKGISVSTYACIGSATPPTNTSAGDLTINRLSVGNLHTMGNSGSGQTVDIVSTTTKTVADVFPQNRQAWLIAPTSNSGSYNFQNFWLIDIQAAAGITNNWIANFVGDNLHHQTGAIDSIYAMNFVALEIDGGSPATAGTVTNLYGAYLRPMYNSAGSTAVSVTNAWGVQIEPNLRFGTGTFTVGTYRGIHLLGPAAGAAYTTFVQLDIAAVTGATTNLGIRNASNSVQTGYASFGAVTAPTNVTDGDLTAVRLFAANLYGSITNASGGTLTLSSTSNATKGKILFGTSAYDEVNNRLGIGQTTPLAAFETTSGADSTGASGTHWAVGFASGGGYRNWIRSRHNAGAVAGSAWDFYTNTGAAAGDSTAPGTNNILGLTINNGRVGINAVGTPGIELDVNGSAWVKTYLRVGAESAPTNTSAGDLTAIRATFPPSTAQNITAVSATILANATVVQLTANASYVLTSTPTIADGADGQVLMIVNADTADSITLQDQGTLASSNLRLLRPAIVLKPRGTITLVYNATVGDWVQHQNGLEPHVEIYRLVSSPTNGDQSLTVNATTYAGFRALQHAVNFDINRFTHFRIVMYGCANEAAQSVTLELISDIGTGSTAVHTGGDDLVVNTNANTNWDSGWRTIDVSLTAFNNTMALAVKGSNSTVDLTHRWIEVHYKYDP